MKELFNFKINRQVWFHLCLTSTTRMNFTTFWEKWFLERTELEFVVYLYQLLLNTVALLSRHLILEYTSNSTLERWPCNVLNAAVPEAPSLYMTVYNSIQWYQIHSTVPGAKKLSTTITTTQNPQELMKGSSSKSR